MAELANDSFDRADGPLGSNWTANSAESGTLTIVSNAVARGTDSDASSIYNAVAWPNDQYSEITIGTVDSIVGNGMGPICRSPSSSAKTYYRFIVSSSGYELLKFVAGVNSSLASGTGTTFAGGDVARLECTGGATTTLKMFKNGVQFGGDITDSSSAITSGNAGIAYSSSSDETIASWAGGDLGGGGGTYNAVPLLDHYYRMIGG